MEKAEKLLDDEPSVNISKIPRRGMSDCSGLTFNDYLFGKLYINLIRKNNLFDFQVLNHEVKHGIDFYAQSILPKDKTPNFSDIGLDNQSLLELSE